MRPKSQTLGDLVDEMAEAMPAADAVVFRDERFNYAALKARVDGFAKAMLAAGVRRGDRVAVLATNRPEWIVAAFGAAKIGAIVAAISTFSTPRELVWTLKHSDAKALISLDAFRGRSFLDGADQTAPPELQTIVSIDGQGRAGIVPLSAFLASSAAIDDAALAAAQRAVTPSDIAYILYTSGSTAAPKGVTLAHGPIIANGFDIGERMHLTAEDRVWLAVPLFWSFGSANALPAILTHGGCAVLQESFEPGEALALIERERCSVYYGMANMARALREHPDHPRRRLGAMRTGLTIGPPEDIAMTIAALGAQELCNVYGSTETYGNCAVCDAHDPVELRVSTQGRSLPGMTIRAVDPVTRRPLPEGETGELAVAGYVTPGYFRAPELDAEAFDAEGYFLTGDLGAVEDGRVHFRGRLKEMIKTGGINVAPLEVEHVLLQHPEVVQAFVVGVPDAVKGEIVAAAVELQPDAATDAPAILAFCRERLASYKVPARLVFKAAAAFPRTATGKIHKPGLKEELANL
ncbi:MAG TPA: AMP-binding protein [Stellaceae bacterium]|nr:AMP-binding protein [Stellaceae bacterium]